MRRAFAPIDTAKQADVVRVVVHAARRPAAGEGPLGVTRAVTRALLGAKAMEASFLGHCEVGQALATRLGFGQGVIHALGQLYGRWGGKGVPDVRAGDVSPVSMCVALAQDVLVHLRLGGDADAALTVVCGRSGRAYRLSRCWRERQPNVAGFRLVTWSTYVSPGSCMIWALSAFRLAPGGNHHHSPKPSVIRCTSMRITPNALSVACRTSLVSR